MGAATQYLLSQGLAQGGAGFEKSQYGVMVPARMIYEPEYVALQSRAGVGAG